jgi:2-polyprenyl-6-hydroxyphenyl methylase/3-demethylubiquinone-9 3-methyltransferase
MWPESWRKSYDFDRMEVFGAEPRSGHTVAYDRRRQMALAAVQEVAPAGARVLDVAAAQGNFTLALAETGYCVTWNDLREDLVGYVQLKHEHGDVDFMPGNIYDIETGATFDLVLMTEIIEHVAHPDRFLARAATLVRPGGHIVLTTPNGQYWRSKLPRFSDCEDPSQFESIQFKPDADGHIFLLHPDELRSLAASAGLEVADLTVFTNSLTAGHVKLRSLLRILPPSLTDSLEELTTSSCPGRFQRRVNTQMAATLRRPPLAHASSPSQP